MWHRCSGAARLSATPLYGKGDKIMKKLFFILLVIIFTSCNQNNPVSPIDSTTNIYLGSFSTMREYERTISLFQPDSNTPFITVPDNLYGKLSFDSTQINQGLVNIFKYQEIVIPRDTSFHNLTSNSSEYCQIKTIDIENKDLETELEFAEQGKPIPEISLGISMDGSMWIENDNQLRRQSNDTTKYIMLQKPISIGDKWTRKINKYKNEDGTYGTFQLDCRVVSQEEVSVKAGNFLAYKIEVTNDWVDIDYKSISGYEYYVPNVGLILMESDMNVFSTTLGSGSTSYFRQVIRQELTRYNFVK